MSLLDLIKRSDILREDIINTCEPYADTSIDKFHDIKNITPILSNIVAIRRIWQKTIFKLDTITENIQNEIDAKERVYNRTLNKEEALRQGLSYDEEDDDAVEIFSPLLKAVDKKKPSSVGTWRDYSEKSKLSQLSRFGPKSVKVSKDQHDKSTTPDRVGFTTVCRNRKRSEQSRYKIDLGYNQLIKLLVYKYKEDIPELSYGAVKNKFSMGSTLSTLYLILYRISKNSYVSCEMGRISSEDGNIRTILCNNIIPCKYENNCKYYHSPLYYPATTHVKFFFKTPLCPKDPTFGDGLLFEQQKRQLRFDDVNTLASDCATKLLQIRLLCQSQSV